MFAIGDRAVDRYRNQEVIVLERIELWDYITYRVYNPTINEVYKLADEELSPLTHSPFLDIHYILYLSMRGKIKNELASGILTGVSDKIIPLPHQLYVLKRAVSTNRVRFILADEVGLGKTIEAGLIIRELKARGIIKRILIVAPKGLVTQWHLEMKDKFNEDFQIILPEEFNTLRRFFESNDIYGRFDQVISPMDSIKPLTQRTGWSQERINQYNEERIYALINSGWDLIVIDEAHRVAGSSSDVARHQLGRLLAASSPYLLLLTATPHNGKTEPFLRLLRLVDPEVFPTAQAVVKEQVAPYIIRTEKREAIDNYGNKLFKDRITHVVEVKWDSRHSLQQELYWEMTKYVRKWYKRALRQKGKSMPIIFLLIMMQRLVTSSTYAIRESLERRLEVIESQEYMLKNLSIDDFISDEFENINEDLLRTMSIDLKAEKNELSRLISIAKQAETQYFDAKLEPLVEILDQLFTKNKDQKVIIFTEFIATQQFLYKFLTNRGYKISLLNGSLDIDERNNVYHEFKKETQILISTDAGGEGLNLQFTNVVINYDFPWNPMKIEQRIGRVDRIGQTKDVYVYNFVLADSIERRVQQVLENKLAVILKELGIDKYSDVLDSEYGEINFSDAYLKSISDPENIESNLKAIEDELREQIQNKNEIKDIIREDKELTDIIGEQSNFNINYALSQMLDYYTAYRGERSEIKNLALNDPEIQKLIHQEVHFSYSSEILKMKIDGFPVESGYFSLWEIMLTDHEQTNRVIPIFMNDDLVIRRVTSERLWDEILGKGELIRPTGTHQLSRKLFDQICTICTNYAYNTFIQMKLDYEKNVKESYDKYRYAIEVRKEAAQHIGIENIKRAKLKQIDQERLEIEESYKRQQILRPELKLLYVVYVEA